MLKLLGFFIYYTVYFRYIVFIRYTYLTVTLSGYKVGVPMPKTICSKVAIAEVCHN